MSRRAAAGSEGIDGVSCSCRFHVRLQPVAVHYVHAAVEQGGDVIFQTGIIKNSDAGGGIEFDHDVASLRNAASFSRRRAKISSRFITYLQLNAPNDTRECANLFTNPLAGDCPAFEGGGPAIF